VDIAKKTAREGGPWSEQEPCGLKKKGTGGKDAQNRFCQVEGRGQGFRWIPRIGLASFEKTRGEDPKGKDPNLEPPLTLGPTHLVLEMQVGSGKAKRVKTIPRPEFLPLDGVTTNRNRSDGRQV